MKDSTVFQNLAKENKIKNKTDPKHTRNINL